MELFTREYGKENKEKLIILHGLYGSSDNWAGIAKEMAEDFHVIIPDLRNHGQSPHSEVHSYPEMTKDVLDVLKKLELKSASILGHSMGGKLAMFFASEYPEKINKLIVADMSPRSFSFEKDDRGNAAFHIKLINTLIDLDIENVANFAEADEKLKPVIPEERLRGFILKNIKKTDSGLKWKINPQGLKNNIENIMQGLDEDDFKSRKIRIQTLFLRGEKSDYISLEDFKLIRFIFPVSEIISIPNAGHWLHAEQPELFIKNVRYFLTPNL